MKNLLKYIKKLIIKIKKFLKNVEIDPVAWELLPYIAIVIAFIIVVVVIISRVSLVF